MSRDKLEILRKAVEAYNARDLDAIIELCDPGIELHSAFALGGGVYHGHDGLRGWHRDLEDSWGQQIRIEPERYVEREDDLLIYFEMLGRGRQSGAEVAMQVAQVWTFRDGLVVYLKAYADRQEALRALDVTEDALEDFPAGA